MKIVHAIIATVAFLGIAAVFIVKNVQFDIGCEGHLKRAADANTVELAVKELEYSVAYLQYHDLTSGYTSVLYRTPDEDMGFWFTNLSASLAELKALPVTSTPLEKSNMLIKLRETLLDQGKEVSITLPYGISRYPNNLMLGIIFIVLCAWMVLAWIFFLIEMDKLQKLRAAAGKAA